MEKDSLFTGLVIGAILPVLGFLFVEKIFDLLAYFQLVAEPSGSGLVHRLQTLTLLAVCCNILPFEWSKRNRYDETIRGLMWPTMIYALYWVYTFANSLF